MTSGSVAISPQAAEGSRKMRRRSRWLRTGITVLVLYLGVILFAGCADRVLLFPTHEPIAFAGLERHVVGEPGHQVEAWSMRSGNRGVPPDAYVLCFVGNASRGEVEADLVAHEWAGHNVEVWAVNYPGYGQSDGRATLAAIPPAALAVYDDLSARAGGKPIFLNGRSLGTAAALYVAAHRPVAGIILQNPPPLQRLIMGHYGWWNLWLAAGPIALQVPSELNSLRNAPKVKAPAVFMLAGQDTLVLPQYQQMVVDAYAGPKRLVRLPDAGHNDLPEGQSLRELRAGINWLNQQHPR